MLRKTWHGSRKQYIAMQWKYQVAMRALPDNCKYVGENFCVTCFCYLRKMVAKRKAVDLYSEQAGWAQVWLHQCLYILKVMMSLYYYFDEIFCQ